MKRVLFLIGILSMFMLTSCGKKERDIKEDNLNSIDSVPTTQSAVSVDEKDDERNKSA